MNQAIDITTSQRKTILALLEKHLPNTTAWVYGSRVKWTSRPQSDLDMVVFSALEQHRKISDLREAFEESNLPFRVDLFVWDEVPEQFRKEIEADHIVMVKKEERVMLDNWRETTLGDLLSFSNGKSSPRRSNGFSHPVYGSNGVIGYSEDTNAEPNTIVVGRVGSYCGSLHYSTRICWVTDNAIRANAIDANDSRFLYYLLQTLRLNNWRAGSGQPLLNQSILSSIPVWVPDPSEQRAIAHILGTLDDKIELNRRMNETLEAMARALFKSWFVDFDPVHAKIEGRDTGLPPDVADIFPDQLVDSELGEIPKGWEVKSLGEELKNLVSGARPRGGAVDVGIPSIGAENVDGLGRHNYSKEKYIPAEFLEKLKSKGAMVRNGDVLLYKDGAHIGRKTYLDSGYPYTKCAVNEHVFILRLRIKASQRFLFFWLDQEWMTQEIISLNSNSAQPGINKVGVRSLPFMVPSSEVLASFDLWVGNFTDYMFANCHESRALAALRDTLLPKLVSGKLQVEKTENR